LEALFAINNGAVVVLEAPASATRLVDVDAVLEVHDIVARVHRGIPGRLGAAALVYRVVESMRLDDERAQVVHHRVTSVCRNRSIDDRFGFICVFFSEVRCIGGTHSEQAQQGQVGTNLHLIPLSSAG